MNHRKLLLIFIISLFFLNDEISFSQETREWVRSYSSPQNSAQQPYDVVTDDAGNIYVTGSTTRGYSLNDMVTIKYNSAGQYVWGRTYNSLAYEYSSDVGRSIAVYKNGVKTYIYSVGVTFLSTINNLVIIKYDENGNQLWLKTYTSSPNGYTHTVPKVMSDASGNCYVSGGNGQSPFVVKYDSSGTLIFNTVVANDSGHFYAKAVDVAIDAARNIYITGDIDTTANNSVSYYTSKLNSAGVLQWKKYFRGTVNSQSRANEIAVGPSGYVYVTGEYWGTDADYLTIKYNPATGDTVWTRKYNGTGNTFDYAKVLALDANENIFVSGMTGPGVNGNVTTVKYNSSGVQQWAKIYAGPGGYADDVRDIITDNSGNVYLTGASDLSYFGKYFTMKYDPNGNVQWTNEYDFAPGDFEIGNAMTMDNSGNVIVTGTSGYETICDFGTMKFNPSGIVQWVKKFYGAEIVNDISNGITTDKKGNIYTVGRTRTNRGDDITALKFDPQGNQKWVYVRGGTFVGYDVYDEGKAIAADTGGNVYITGSVYTNSANKQDLFTAKLDSNGTSTWFVISNGSAMDYGSDEGVDIAVDKTGNVYVAGNVTSLGGNLSYNIMKYNNAGTILWTRAYNGTGNDSDLVTDLTLDAAGNVYLTGKSKGVGTGYDIATVKYNSAGVYQWAVRYNGSANGNDEVRSMDVDKNGNVYITGSALNTSTGNDLIVVKYLSNGLQSWVHTSDGGPNLKETGVVVKYDSLTKYVHVTGNLKNFLYNSLSLFTTLIDSTGYGGLGGIFNPSNNNTLCYGGALDAAGVMNTAHTEESPAGNDINVNRRGSWSDIYNGASNGNDFPAAKDPVAVYNNNVYVAGSSYDSVNGTAMTVIKYSSPLYYVQLKMFIQGFYRPNFGTVIPDTVVVRLRNKNSPFQIMDSSKVICSGLGDVSALFSNTFSNGPYYITVNHRNSIETWSDSAVLISGGYVFHNMSYLPDVYGGNLIFVPGPNGANTIYGGDINQDKSVDLADVILANNDANSFVTGYVKTDVTGNNITDLTDVILCYNNAGNFVSVKKP